MEKLKRWRDYRTSRPVDRFLAFPCAVSYLVYLCRYAVPSIPRAPSRLYVAYAIQLLLVHRCLSTSVARAQLTCPGVLLVHRLLHRFLATTRCVLSPWCLPAARCAAPSLRCRALPRSRVLFVRRPLCRSLPTTTCIPSMRCIARPSFDRSKAGPFPALSPRCLDRTAQRSDLEGVDQSLYGAAENLK